MFPLLPCLTDYINITTSEDMLPTEGRCWTWMAFSSLLCPKALELQLLLLLMCQRQAHVPHVALPLFGCCCQGPAERIPAQGCWKLLGTKLKWGSPGVFSIVWLQEC